MSEYEITDVWFIRSEFKQMRLFLDVIEKAISMYEDKLEEWYPLSELDERVEDPDFDVEYNKYFDEFSSVIFDFPRRIYMSFIVSWVSFVEESLLRLCHSLHLLKYDEMDSIKGSGIWVAKSVIHANSNISADSPIWEEMEFIVKLRNIIVHKNGTIPVLGDIKKKPTLKYPTFQGHYVRIPKSVLIYLIRNNIIGLNKNLCGVTPSKEYCRLLVEYGNKVFDTIFNEFDLNTFP